MMRTSTLIGRRPPTASTAPSCSARSSLTCAVSGSSLTSSRNSVPPEASTNLPSWRSVAPVNAPFSWPNRIDSTRLSGIAPQFTATNGLARRSLEPWMARANSSLPTPDSPSISTGIAEPAAFSAARSTGAIASLRVMISENVSRPSRAWRMRCSSPFIALAFSALRSDTCRRSMPTGLTTKSCAPARIADTTLSMPPCAVCTITGTSSPLARIFDSTPSPSSPGITRSSTTASIAGASGAVRASTAASPLSTEIAS